MTSYRQMDNRDLLRACQSVILPGFRPNISPALYLSIPDQSCQPNYWLQIMKFRKNWGINVVESHPDTTVLRFLIEMRDCGGR